MILDDLTLYNFGVFVGRQTIVLTPPSNQQPVVLFGALNGGGKTTLLDALQLCLFGPIARCSNRGSMAYHDYLEQCINQKASPLEASLTLTFRQLVDGQEDTFRLLRAWHKSGKSVSETFSVVRNGKLDRGLTDNWFEQVDDFIPSRIAHLFLFDGEKIESFADQKESASLIGSAIQNLLGLDIVDQLEKDLQTMERRKRSEAKNAKSRAEIDNAEQELKTLRQRQEQLQQELAQIRGRQDRREKDLKLVLENFRKAGGELFEHRTELENKQSEAIKNRDTVKKHLVELAAGPLPLLLIHPLLISLLTRDKVELETLKAREVLDVIAHRDESLLAFLSRQGMEKKLLTACLKHLESDRTQWKKNAERTIALNIGNEVRDDLEFLLRNELKILINEANKGLANLAIAEEDVAHYDLEVASIPSKDTLFAIIKDRDQVKEELKSLESTIDSRQSGLERLERDIDRKESELRRMLEADANEEVERQERERTLKHSGRVRGTLAKFRQAIILRHVHHIEQLILESFQHLLRKRFLLTGLEINPDTFELILYGPNNQAFPTNRLSAGERQLLAVSILWGLAKASGRPLPTAIDTPMGRLDTGHRSNLVERYFPYASHQVLLLSTDEEIIGEYLRKLAPWIGRSYLLNFDEEQGVTTIQEGYFAKREPIDAH